MKIIPTWPRASLPRFYQMALLNICSISFTEHFIMF